MAFISWSDTCFCVVEKHIYLSHQNSGQIMEKKNSISNTISSQVLGLAFAPKQTEKS